jgi:hypothetical protein
MFIDLAHVLLAQLYTFHTFINKTNNVQNPYSYDNVRTPFFYTTTTPPL